MRRDVFATYAAVIAVVLLVVATPRGEEPSNDEHRQNVETVAALCRIGAAIEEFSIDHDQYPQASSLEALTVMVVPRYVRQLPEVDGWGNVFFIDSTPQRYTIASCGKGAVGGCTPGMVGRGGESADPRTDTVFSNGVFYQWPDGVFGEFDGERPGCRHMQSEELARAVTQESDNTT
jgi:hypothetical protein